MIEQPRKLTLELHTELDKWINRTKKFNGFPLGIWTTHPSHKIVRKALMHKLSKMIQTQPPIKIGKNTRRKFKCRGL